MTATQDGDALIRRLIKQTVIWLLVLGAILFLSAGTSHPRDLVSG